MSHWDMAVMLVAVLAGVRVGWHAAQTADHWLDEMFGD